MPDIFSPYIRALQSGDKSERKCFFTIFFFRKGEYIFLFIDDVFLVWMHFEGLLISSLYNSLLKEPYLNGILCFSSSGAGMRE